MRNLLEACVTGDRCDLMRCASGFREPTTSGLAQPVERAALEQPGGVARYRTIYDFGPLY